RQPGVAAAAGIAIVPVRIGSSKAAATVINPDALKGNILLTTQSGDLNALGPSTLLISKKVSDDHGWKVGTVLNTGFSEGGTTKLRIAGIYKENQLAGGYLMDQATAARFVTNLTDVVSLVSAKPGADPDVLRKTIENVLSKYPGIKVQSRGEYVQSAQHQIGQLVNLIYVLLALSVLIAFFGIVNTLALSVTERTREIGLLRAVGMSRAQLRRVVRLESVAISLFGAVMGLVLGLFFGIAVQRALSDTGLDVLSIPYGSLVLFLVFAALAGVFAAIWPARRAAKLDVLKAITTE